MSECQQRHECPGSWMDAAAASRTHNKPVESPPSEASKLERQAESNILISYVDTIQY